MGQPRQRETVRSARQGKGQEAAQGASSQRKMLLPISGSGKRAAKEEPKKAAKPVRAPARSKNAG